MSVFTEFQWRGMVYEASEGLQECLAREKVTAYIGFDPSASSLHVGSLLPVMALARLQHHGHTPIAIIGGGTGLIGDPSGKSEERPLLSKEQVDANLHGIKKQLSHFLDFKSTDNAAKIINNSDWLSSISMLDFLRDVGKHYSVNYMLAKVSVKKRMVQDGGISFTEFSYMLLQAYDYFVLYNRYGCKLQMGGSDQWGNILAGIELIRRTRGGEAHGLVFPLVTTSTGTKFGKTEAGTVWLDLDLTSPFRFYQFWINTDDRDVITYLKYFTLLNKVEIHNLKNSLSSSPENREAQKMLAEEVTRMVHGETALQEAIRASRVLFGEKITDLSASEVADIFSDVPSSQMYKAQFVNEGLPVVDLALLCGFAKSKGEARRLIEGGGFYINNRRIKDSKFVAKPPNAIEGQYLVLRKGVKEYHLIQLLGS